MSNQSKFKKFLPELTVAAIVFLMVWMAGVVHDHEVIFPEIAAIATGALLAPKYVWNVSKKQIFGLLLLCGLIGMGIVRYLPIGLAGQMMVAAVLSQLIYLYSRTSFAPLVSGIVLPVLLQTRSVWFLVSLVLFTGIILGASCLIEMNQIRPKNVYVKPSRPEREDFVAAFFRCVVMCSMIACALGNGIKFAVAPPLLVAFTEFCKPGTKISAKWSRLLFLMTSCAVVGAAARYFGTVKCGLPLYISAVIAIGIFFIILRGAKIYLPPAGAMVVLAMLIPEDAILFYPGQIFLGAVAYLMASVIYQKVTERDEDDLVSEF